jgi:hypothetical protein
MQLEKTDTAKSKTDTAKSKRNLQQHFAYWHDPSQCGVHFEMRRRQYTHMLNFAYEDNIKGIVSRDGLSTETIGV